MANRARIVGIVIAVAAIAAVIRFWRSADRSLESRSHLVVNTAGWWGSWLDGFGPSYFWLSDSKVGYLKQHGPEFNDLWLYGFDLKTGQSAALERVNRVIDQSDPAPYFEVSDSGKWLLWHGHRKNYRNTVICCRVDGTQHRTYDGFVMAFWAGDDRWLRFEEDPEAYLINGVAATSDFPRFRKRGTIRKAGIDKVLATTDRGWPDFRSLGSISSPMLCVDGRVISVGDETGLAFKPQVDVYVYPLDAKNGRTQHYIIKFENGTPQFGAIHPGGHRIAFTVIELERPAYPEYLIRWLPFLRRRIPARQSIKVCDIDGRNMREVGYTTRNKGWPGLLGLRWTLDGRSLSYIQDGNLYMIPADQP